jgi:decaprenylphospho-beta-D-erythro-pentofuranosid-2-ulose 2-reductase
MKNAFGEPQTVLVLGGTSDIGVAIVRALTSPSLRHVVLACRTPAKAEPIELALRRDGVTISVDTFDAANTGSHQAYIADVVSRVGDLDVVIMAFGVLGEQSEFDADPQAAVAAAHINYTGSVSAGLVVANQLRAQGHGQLVFLSSVAGERVRKANFVYGSTKAGLDGFAQGLGDSLEGSGASVLVVRPGFVHSAMTQGMKAAPFATTPEKVAAVTVAGLRSGRRTVWAPGILRFVFSALRHVPGPIWRRLPLG